MCVYVISCTDHVAVAAAERLQSRVGRFRRRANIDRSITDDDPVTYLPRGRTIGPDRADRHKERPQRAATKNGDGGVGGGTGCSGACEKAPNKLSVGKTRVCSAGARVDSGTVYSECGETSENTLRAAVPCRSLLRSCTTTTDDAKTRRDGSGRPREWRRSRKSVRDRLSSPGRPAKIGRVTCCRGVVTGGMKRGEISVLLQCPFFMPRNKNKITGLVMLLFFRRRNESFADENVGSLAPRNIVTTIASFYCVLYATATVRVSFHSEVVANKFCSARRTDVSVLYFSRRL